MANHEIIRAAEDSQARRPNHRLELLRHNFDAEIALPTAIPGEFLSAALLWAIENKVDFGLFHEADRIVIVHFGGDDPFLPSRWSDNRWHIGLEDKDHFDPAD